MSGGFKLFGYAIMTSFIVFAIFPLYGMVAQTDATNFQTSVPGIAQETFSIDDSWSSPQNGTIQENTCDTNGSITTADTCTYEIEYDVSDLQYGTPTELEYNFDRGTGDGNWTIIVRNPGDGVSSELEGDVEKTALTTTHELDFEDRDWRTISLIYDLENTNPNNESVQPDITSSDLTINTQDTQFEFGLTEGILTLFTMLAFVGGSIIILWVSA